MTKDALYTLEELAQAAQVTPRAVRYYAAKGLLPAPQSRGRYALYGTAHLNRLRLIAQLKQALLPLAAMRDRMLCLTEAQVGALLTRSEWPIGHAHPEAGDALTEVPPDSAGATLEEQAESYQYLLDALTARPSADTVTSFEPSQPTQLSRRALFPHPHPEEEEKEKRRKGEKEIGGQELGNREQGTEEAQLVIETWQRVILAPGVELHIRAPQSTQANEKIKQLIAEAKSLLQT